MIFFDHFLLSEPQLTTALFVCLYLAGSMATGLVLRRGWIEGAAWGFLILGGAANLILFVSRTLDLTVDLFLPLVLLLTAGLSIALRIFLPTSHQSEGPTLKIYWGVLALFVVVLWSGNILNHYPDSAFSSHHGWVPLYVQKAFSAGHFLNVEDMAFGNSMVSSLFYPADLIGIVAVAGAIGVDGLYPAFNAASIAATMLMFAILAHALRTSSFALLAFLAFSMLIFAIDPFFRTTLGGNWGDVLMYLGGGLVCFYLTQVGRTASALKLAALASVFLVFGRHYGAFYAAVTIAACFAVFRWRTGRFDFLHWVFIGSTWFLFSARELYYLVLPVSEYYPGSWQVERMAFTFEQLFKGTLTDWGILSGSDLSVSGLSLRSLYVLALLVTLWALRRKKNESAPDYLGLFAPFLLMVLPLVLQTVMGYRTNAHYSKLYVVSVFFMAWYPAYNVGVIARTLGHDFFSPRTRQAAYATLVAVPLIAGGWQFDRLNLKRFFVDGVDQGLRLAFNDDIADREIAAGIRKTIPASEFSDFIDRPIMYFYYEPGIALRYYLGGDFFNDIDFWGPQIGQFVEKSDSFLELLEKTGYPNVYIGLTRAGRAPDFEFSDRKKFIDEIETDSMLLETVPTWATAIIKHGKSRFFVVRRPQS